MDRNTIAAVVLCFIVLIGFQTFFVNKNSSTEEKKSSSQALPKEESSMQSKEMEGGQAPTENEFATIQKESPGLPTQRLDQRLNIENDFFIAEISRLTGGVLSWKLKKYKNEKEDFIELMPAKLPEAGDSLNLESLLYVNQKWETLYPFEIVSQSNEEIILKYDGEAFSITKSYHFNPEKYSVDLSISFVSKKKLEAARLAFVLRDHHVNEEAKGFLFFSDRKTPQRLLLMTQLGKMSSETLEGLQNGKELLPVQGERVQWIGVDDQYFLKALISHVPTQDSNEELGRASIDSNDSGVTALLWYAAPQESTKEQSVMLSFFAGPKDLDILSAAHTNLSESVDYGWFRWIALPLLSLLKLFYGFIHNYGIAILLLTLFVKTVLYPLTHKSLKSAKEMQRIQPQMELIKKKYQNNKETMNREIMQLMKSNKVNPLGGCFPMLLQLPVFIALYRVFGSSIELRGAPFIFWIQDLSIKDPYFVTPLFTGVITFVQQKMTPTTADAAQMKMMLYTMPLFMTAILLYLPSGLTLYILCNTVLTIVQQHLINRRFPQTVKASEKRP
ncbi:MAG: membrane protein insertase YidC [Deltaproteobacteria bacterium]|nr:membrane protein insertase YidC [Deltaproteobacteria bacterium]